MRFKLYVQIIFIIGIFLSNSSYSQDTITHTDSTVLHLVISHGFLPGELIKIMIIDDTGNENIIFSDNLLRINHQSVNFFKIKLKKNKMSMLKVNCPWREVEVKHGFIISQDTFIDLSINPKNEFLFISSESLDGYD